MHELIDFLKDLIFGQSQPGTLNQKEINKMRELRKSLNSTLEELEDELENLNNEIAEKEERADEISKEIASLENDASNIQTEISRVEESIKIITGKKRN